MGLVEVVRGENCQKILVPLPICVQNNSLSQITSPPRLNRQLQKKGHSGTNKSGSSVHRPSSPPEARARGQSCPLDAQSSVSLWAMAPWAKPACSSHTQQTVSPANMYLQYSIIILHLWYVMEFQSALDFGIPLVKRTTTD